MGAMNKQEKHTPFCLTKCLPFLPPCWYYLVVPLSCSLASLWFSFLRKMGVVMELPSYAKCERQMFTHTACICTLQMGLICARGYGFHQVQLECLWYFCIPDPHGGVSWTGMAGIFGEMSC